MPVKDKNKAMLRQEAEKLIARLEKIPDAKTHLLAGPGSISIAVLITQLREFRSHGKNFINEYMRPSRKFRDEVIDPMLAVLEAKYGLPQPQGSRGSSVRIRRYQ